MRTIHDQEDPIDAVQKAAERVARELGERDDLRTLLDAERSRNEMLTERLDRSEMAVALVRNYATLLRSCDVGGTSSEFVRNVADAIEQRTAGVAFR